MVYLFEKDLFVLNYFEKQRSLTLDNVQQPICCWYHLQTRPSKQHSVEVTTVPTQYQICCNLAQRHPRQHFYDFSMSIILVDNDPLVVAVNFLQYIEPFSYSYYNNSNELTLTNMLNKSNIDLRCSNAYECHKPSLTLSIPPPDVPAAPLVWPPIDHAAPSPLPEWNPLGRDLCRLNLFWSRLFRA